MKRKFWTLILAGLLALTACGGGKDADKEADSGADADAAVTEETADTGGEAAELPEKLIMGLDDTFAPMGFRDANGELVGFDIDLSKAVGEKIGVTFEYQPIDWAMKETELNSKNIDLIWNGYTITDKRKEEVAFSQPYLDNAQIIVVLKDSPIQTKADLAGKVVTTQAESSTIDAFAAEPDVLASFKDGKPVEFATFTECFNDLDSGRSDALVGDKVLVGYTMTQVGEDKYRVLEDNFGTEEFGIGIRKEDTALLDAINTALDELKADGTYDEIYNTWFAD